MNNAFRHDQTRGSSVGLGGNIAKSLFDVSQHRTVDTVPPSFDAVGEDAGNGSLMRFAPIAIYLHSASWDDVYYYARMSSYTTHPGIIAAEACSFLAHLLVKALRLPHDHDRNAQRFLDEAAAEYFELSGLSKKYGHGYDQMKWLVTSSPRNETERCWDWKSKRIDVSGTLVARGRSYNGYPVSADYFGSYSLDGMALALWSVYHTTSFDEAVTRSVNFLGDADSHGSITGQIAGAFYGCKSINPQFISWLSEWDEHEFAARAVLLHRLGLSRTDNTPSYL
jgi:ADP-ribosylglycohydrolase